MVFISIVSCSKTFKMCFSLLSTTAENGFPTVGQNLVSAKKQKMKKLLPS